MGLARWVAAVSTVLMLSLVATPTDAAPFNVTAVIAGQPGFSQFNSLLSSTGVANEVNARSSISVLVVADAVLTSFLAAYPNAGTAQIGDLLRYHVLLQYLDIPELNTITVGNPSTVTTLYQTTGRAAGNSGSVNIYNDGTNILVGQADVNTAPNITILSNVTQIPYNISVLQVDGVVAPTGFGAPTAGANLSAILEAGRNFNTFNSLLQSTGVGAEFATLQTGQGITIFAPTDAAFAALPNGALNLLTPAQTKLVVEYHALTSYYTLGSLSTLNNPAAPTVATTNSLPGSYLLNVSSAASGVVINSGLSQATISSTLYDTPPTVLFAINTILLPPAIFATAPAPAPALVPGPAPVPSGPVPAPAPLAPTPALSPLSPTPVPAPSPLTPSPTPTPTPTPSPTPSSTPSPSPTPTPTPAPGPAAFSPGPPAPPLGPAGSTTPEGPGEAPDGSTPGSPNHGTSTSVNVAVLAAMAVVSSVIVML